LHIASSLALLACCIGDKFQVLHRLPFSGVEGRILYAHLLGGFHSMFCLAELDYCTFHKVRYLYGRGVFYVPTRYNVHGVL
jgi:hypothetical protein